MTKYYELFSNDPTEIMMPIGNIARRCVGEEIDPDTQKDYSKFKKVTISIVRSNKHLPEAMEEHNIFSNHVYTFTVKEFADDHNKVDTLPKINQIFKAAKTIPFKRSTSHFFLKVDIK